MERTSPLKIFYLFYHVHRLHCIEFKADSRFVTSQWETVLLCNDVSHWLDANRESVLKLSTWIAGHTSLRRRTRWVYRLSTFFKHHFPKIWGVLIQHMTLIFPPFRPSRSGAPLLWMPASRRWHNYPECDIVGTGRHRLCEYLRLHWCHSHWRHDVSYHRQRNLVQQLV